MTNSQTYRALPTILPALLLAGLIIAPLSGLPASIGGIPVWYQDTFFYGWFVLSLAGIIIVAGYLKGFFQPVRWNYVDLGVLILCLYILVRTVTMDFIPQSAWIQIAYLAGGYGISRMLWPSLYIKSLHLLIAILLLTGILEVGYGLAQLYGLWPSHHHLYPLTGSFFNPGPYSGWLACMVPVAVYGILQKEGSAGNHELYYLAWAYLILTALVIIPASSRAAILAAITGSMVVAWSRVRESFLWRRSWFRGTIAILLITGLAGLYLMKKDSADGRLLIYKVTADMIAEAPVFGWGWDGFPTMYNNFQAVYFQSGAGSEREKYLADNVTYGFNEVLEFTAEMGILGLLLVVGIAALLIRKWWQRNKAYSIHSIHFLGLGVLASWTTFALFSYPMSIPALVIVLPVTLSGLNTVLSKVQSDKLATNESKRQITGLPGKMITGMLIFGISAYGLYWIHHFRPLAGEWAVANANQKLLRYEFANNHYRILGPRFRNEGLFLQYAGKSMSLDRQIYDSAYFLERALFFSADPTIFTTLGKDYTLFSKVDVEKKKRAEFLLSRAKYISPYKYYPRYLLAQYYTSIGESQKALEEAESLLAKEPKVMSPATQEIRNQMQQLLIDQEILQPEETRFRMD